MAQDAFSYSLTSPDPASFFHFHFPPIEYLILSSSCLLHQEITGLLEGEGGDGSVGKMLAESKDLHSHPQNLCKTKGTLCSFSVPTGSGSQTQDSPQTLEVQLARHMQQQARDPKKIKVKRPEPKSLTTQIHTHRMFVMCVCVS